MATAPKRKQTHKAVIFRCFVFGFAPKDLRLGLIQASQNKIGNLVDQVLLYCYHYDPATGKYGAVVMRILRLAGAATILAIGVFMIVMFRRGSSTRSRAARAT